MSKCLSCLHFIKKPLFKRANHYKRLLLAFMDSALNKCFLTFLCRRNYTQTEFIVKSMY